MSQSVARRKSRRKARRRRDRRLQKFDNFPLKIPYERYPVKYKLTTYGTSRRFFFTMAAIGLLIYILPAVFAAMTVWMGTSPPSFANGWLEAVGRFWQMLQITTFLCLLASPVALIFAVIHIQFDGDLVPKRFKKPPDVSTSVTVDETLSGM